jgi:hypothetical protein
MTLVGTVMLVMMMVILLLLLLLLMVSILIRRRRDMTAARWEGGEGFCTGHCRTGDRLHVQRLLEQLHQVAHALDRHRCRLTLLNNTQRSTSPTSGQELRWISSAPPRIFLNPSSVHTPLKESVMRVRVKRSHRNADLGRSRLLASLPRGGRFPTATPQEGGPM